MAKLTYDEFLEMTQRTYQGSSWILDNIWDEDFGELKDREDVFFVTWVSGGVTGGNCWEDGGHYPVEPEEEPDLDNLVDLLEEIGVSLREGRKILALVKTGSAGESGYYGNHTRYGCKYVTFDAVYDKLVEFEKAEPRPGAPTP